MFQNKKQKSNQQLKPWHLPKTSSFPTSLHRHFFRNLCSCSVYPTSGGSWEVQSSKPNLHFLGVPSSFSGGSVYKTFKKSCHFLGMDFRKTCRIFSHHRSLVFGREKIIKKHPRFCSNRWFHLSKSFIEKLRSDLYPTYFRQNGSCLQGWTSTMLEFTFCEEV